MPITYGLLRASNGCPVAVEVFAGNTADPAAVAAQVDTLRRRFRIGRVALVGDRGMLTTARLRNDLAPANRDRTLKILGREVNRRKAGKHFDVHVHDTGLD